MKTYAIIAAIWLAFALIAGAVITGAWHLLAPTDWHFISR